MNLPNRLTVARFLLAVLFVVLMAIPQVGTYIAAYAVFVVGTLTDYYDGKIARERNLVTNFGKLFDPLADKVFLTACFVVLMKRDDLWIPAWTVVVVLAREFLITGARSLAASEGVVIGANVWGKTKAVVQMIYIFTFLFLVILGKILAVWFGDFVANRYRPVLWHASCWCMVFVALFTLYSGIQFARINWRSLQLREP